MLRPTVQWVIAKPRSLERQLAQNDPFYEDLIASLSHLRAFARLLARNPARAEDLVQDTVVRAISHRDQFQPGTNLRAWLITILRNCYFNDVRRNAKRAAWNLDLGLLEPSKSGSHSGGQEERLQLRDVKREFEKLPATQREAILLVGVNGFSYEEAAQIAGCAIGTMKSRVSRARSQLQSALYEFSDAGAPGLVADSSTKKIGASTAVFVELTAPCGEQILADPAPLQGTRPSLAPPLT